MEFITDNNPLFTIIIDYMKTKKSTYALYSILYIIIPAIVISIPYYYGYLIELLSKMEQTVDKKQIYIAIIILISLWVIQKLIYHQIEKMNSKFIPKLESYIRQSLISKIMQHYKNNYQQLNIGSIVTKLVHIPVIISDIFDLVQGYFLPNLLIFVMTVIYLFYINKTLGAIALASLTYLVYNLYNKTAACVNISTSTESSQNHLNDHVEDMINNLLTIYTSGTEKEELEKLKQYHKIHAHHFSSTLLCTSHINRLSTYMSGLFFSSVAAFALYLYVNKNIPLYQFISVLTISLWIVDRIGTIEDKTRELVQCLGSIKHSNDYLRELNFTVSNNTPISRKIIGDIRFTNVSKTNYTTLASFSIPAKTTVALTGKIGTGKTTFIKMLLKVSTFDTGMIYIDNIPITQYDVTDLRKQIHYVAQNPILFDRSIIDNINYGINLPYNELINILKQHTDIYFIFSKKLNTSAGKNGSNLSGGQRQILLLLRCLIQHRPIILLDEPSASLDENIKNIILRLIKQLSADSTIIIITHDKDLLKYTDFEIKL